MNWLILIVAGLFEVGWATGLSFSKGFTQLVPSILTALCMVISVYLLSVAVQSLPMGTAYAVWTGIGALGAVIAGIILFNEPVTPLRCLFLASILIGIAGLKITS